MKLRIRLGSSRTRTSHAGARRRKSVAILSAVGVAGGLCAGIANAAVTSPSEGAVYRGGVVPIVESVGGRRLDAAGNEIPNNAGAPNFNACGTTSSSATTTDPASASSLAHTRIKLFKPGDSTTPIVNALSPTRTIGTIAGIFPVYDRGGPFSVQWTIPDDAEPGVYTVVVSVTDRKRSTATVLSGTTSTLAACTSTTTTETRTFEYRPWTNKFKDFFDNGDVSFNLAPREFAATIHGVSTPIVNGGENRMRVFSLSDPTGLAFPDDPSTCAGDPASCLPAGAAECAPSDTACDGRFVVINWAANAQSFVRGVFDLDTKAFLAAVSYGGNSGVLFSLGTEGDAAARDLLNQIAALAAEQGIDLWSLLATRVKVTLHNGGESTVVAVSLLRALQIYTEKPGGPTGVSIEAPLTATVGLFAHSYRFSNVANPTGVASEVRGCATAAANGKCSLTQPATAATSIGRFTPASGYGYNVLKSDLLPDLPKVGLPTLPAIPGLPELPVSPGTATGLTALAASVIPTKFFNIHGKWPTAACDGSIFSPHSGCHTTKIGLDTNPGEPHGLPVWIAPLSLLPQDPAEITADPAGTALAIALQALLGLGLPTFPDSAMDFLGTASWSTSEACSATACSGSGSMSGLGVGIFTPEPLPIGFRNIPIWDPQSPEVVALIAAINQAIADGQAAANEQVAALLADPTIVMVLEAIFGNLPPLPELPAVPDLGAVPLP